MKYWVLFITVHDFLLITYSLILMRIKLKITSVSYGLTLYLWAMPPKTMNDSLNHM